MPNDAIENLRLAIEKRGFLIGDSATFNQKMQIPESRLKFHQAMEKRNINIGTFEEFESKITAPIQLQPSPIQQPISKSIIEQQLPTQPPKYKFDPSILTQPSLAPASEETLAKVAARPTPAPIPKPGLTPEVDKALGGIAKYYTDVFFKDFDPEEVSKRMQTTRSLLEGTAKYYTGTAKAKTLEDALPEVAYNAFKGLTGYTTIPADVIFQYRAGLKQSKGRGGASIAGSLIKTSANLLVGLGGFVGEQAERLINASELMLPLYALHYNSWDKAKDEAAKARVELYKNPIDPIMAFKMGRGLIKRVVKTAKRPGMWKPGEPTQWTTLPPDYSKGAVSGMIKVPFNKAKGMTPNQLRALGLKQGKHVAVPTRLVSKATPIQIKALGLEKAKGWGMEYKPIPKIGVPPISKQPLPTLTEVPIDVSVKAKDVEFIGYQEVPGQPSIPLYNIIKEGHPRYGSTVGVTTLRDLGIPVPKTPRPTPIKPGVIPKQYREQLSIALKGTKKIRSEVTEEKRVELGRRVRKLKPTREALLTKGVPSEKAIILSTGKLKGPLTKYTQRFESIRDKVPERVLESYFKTIARHPDLSEFEILASQNALTKLIDGSYLTLGDARSIWKAFKEASPGLEKAAMKHIPLGERSWRVFQEVVNIPYTTLTNVWDVSGLTRQGRFLAQRYPSLAPTFTKKYAQAFVSEKATRDIVKGYRASSNYDRAIKLGLQITEEPSLSAPLSLIEERFLGAPILERIPVFGKYVIRPTARSFTASLNWYRMSIVDRIIGAADAIGKPLTDKKLHKVIGDVNDMSGRSRLQGQSVQHMAPFINAMFAPRFTISRVKMIGKAFYRPSVTAGWASLIGTNLAIMYLVKMAGGDNVEIEPDLTAVDGGKIKIGNTRFDLWAGELPYARTLMRMGTGRTKSAAGHIYPLNYKKEIFNILRSRTNPLYSLMIDAIQGQSYIGEKFGAPPRDKVGEWMNEKDIPKWAQSVSKEVWNRMGPLTMQDITDALIYEGLPMAITAGIMGFTGTGVQTYPESIGTITMKFKDQLAQEEFKKNWDDIGPNAQKILRTRNKDLRELEQQQRYERSIGPEERSYKVEPLPGIDQELQQMLGKLSIPTPSVSRKIASDWVLTDKRYAEYQELAALYINTLLENVTGKVGWGTAPDEWKRKLINTQIDFGKEFARKKIQTEANVQDIETLKEKKGKIGE